MAELATIDLPTEWGAHIAALDEIRVQASPNWGAEKVTVFFWFLLEPERISDFEAARQIVQGWIAAISLTGAFVLAEQAFEILEPQDMTSISTRRVWRDGKWERSSAPVGPTWR